MPPGTYQDSMAGAIIQASEMVIFEDVLMTDAAAAQSPLYKNCVLICL